MKNPIQEKPIKGSLRVFRGGSWNNYPGRVRTSNRNYYVPTAQGHYLGFRIVRNRR